MDFPGDVSRVHDALVFMSFLQQTPIQNFELQQELDLLCSDVINDNKYKSPYVPDCGQIETDGGLHSNFRDLLANDHPQGDLQGPGNQINAEGLGAVTSELREIADQFQHHVLTRATDRLANKLCNSAVEMWETHLTLEVDWIVKQSQASDLPQERVMMALALTLVKGVCERTPRLLRNLFYTTMRYLR